jgi:glyoxylase-like metal-dependent hydrolase (beta-lactamase superfamily II)
MSPTPSRRELGRGERVLPGLWRLRLTLPWPGVPHCNAWAIAAGEGFVLVDCGMHQPGSVAQLEQALSQVGLGLEQCRRLVITHAHSDHWGQAGTVVDRSGCEMWMHPDHQHATASETDPEHALSRRLEVARQSGVPDAALRRYAEHLREMPSGIVRVVDPDRELVDGVSFDTDLGTWTVYETPGHAPSHVCLFQPERRLLISGDHLLGRISLYYDYGWTPDPIAEFLRSLEVVEELDARLCMSGHGRTFTDIGAHIAGNRQLVRARLAAAVQGVADSERTALALVPAIFGEPITEETASWRLTETLCYLNHLEREGRVTRRGGDDGAEQWHAAEPRGGRPTLT